MTVYSQSHLIFLIMLFPQLSSELCTEQTNIYLIFRICYLIRCLNHKYCYKCVLIQYIILLIKILEWYIIIKITVKMCRSFVFLSRQTILFMYLANKCQNKLLYVRYAINCQCFFTSCISVDWYKCSTYLDTFSYMIIKNIMNN